MTCYTVTLQQFHQHELYTFLSICIITAMLSLIRTTTRTLAARRFYSTAESSPGMLFTMQLLNRSE